ncbi:MAG: protein kinase, partial [Acidobacteria bacterium]|nr:protein kinase [Acidobacteriota bacterium]NIM61919.1 protein kinase [Acidobacteriota bacterium]NIO58228.1 protein kinase [Acidobacteriota bacterium]NIQ29249.1 protein kinase [Acidobacteriota bacterium]NIQ83835.1 protein kinase [Acidobacteriota bacterium]
MLSKLGEGGMGVVYEAEQQHPRRRVAIKVVRGGQFVDEQRVRMFQREADTLARLKHPNIGGIYESGRTEDGQHFFAMELVQGETLQEYIAKRPEVLDEEELRFRLGLFRKIADAVHYAHQRGVIHRDLKPSNIIVTPETSASGVTSVPSGARLPSLKILDFGLARITEGDVAAATMTTEVGVIKGTLAYMSPEQARGDPDEIDVRTDVYALGVMLYELLAGKRPYDVLRKSLAEAVRVICEENPKSLTQAWRGPRKLDPDVETIAATALEKEADRRYASAAALSEDIGRYLTSQPILARPPSAAYQLKKLISRNKAVSAALAAVVVVLAVATVVSSGLFVKASREASHAQANAILASASDVDDPVVKALLVRELDGFSRLTDKQLGRALGVLGAPLPIAIFGERGPPLPDPVLSQTALSPDDARVAAAAADGTIRVWRTDGSGEPLVLTGHTAVNDIAFSPDSTRLVTAGFDQTVRVWPLDGGEPVVLRGHEQWVNRAVFSPDGLRIVSAGDDGTARIWPADGAAEPIVLRGHDDSVFDAKFSPDSARVVTASRDGTARVWPAAGSGRPVVL